MVRPALDPLFSPPPGPARSWLAEAVRRVGRQALPPVVRRLIGPAGAGFGVLTYHRVTPTPTAGPAPTWNVSPDRFAAQLDGLLAAGYRPWPLRRALAEAAAGRPLPARTFAVTFDDGYSNVHAHALPVLRRLGVPATVFLATAYLDTNRPFPCDDWAGAGTGPAEAWRPLTTRQCLELQADGLVELGCHTHSHQVFRGRPDDLAADLAASAGVLRERFGVTAPTFAFPFGICDPDLTAVVRASGRACALTTDATLVGAGADPFAWGRFNVEGGDTAAVLAAFLDGWHGAARRVWRLAGGGS